MKKNKRGRKRLAAAKIKIPVSTSLTPEEIANMTRQAQRESMTRSQLLRKAWLEYYKVNGENNECPA